MNWSDLIFSDDRSFRLRRHLLFWLLWWLYFTASYYHYEQSGLKQIEFEPWSFPFFTKSILLLFLHMLACYYFTVYLMPQFLFKAKYNAFAFRAFVLGFLIFWASYFLHKAIFPLVDAAFNSQPKLAGQNIWWTSICSGLLSAPKVICAAAAIKLIKRWWIKQKEKEKLEQEKLITELQLLKAQLHPEFLFSSLNQILYLTRKKDSGKASALLLKLADILSYMLYECDSGMVPLEKEIKTIRDYLLLWKSKMNNRLEIDVAVKGEPNTKMIAPLLLFSFVENCFSFIDSKMPEQNWINLEFAIGNNDVTMKLVHGRNMEQILSENEYSNSRAIKWLNFFYPGAYDLKTTVEPDMMMTSLNIQLTKFPMRDEKNIYTEQFEYATV